LAFHEKNGAGWIGGCVLDPVKGLEGTFGEGTEKAVTPQLTDYTVLHQFKTVW
jgi:hypothetical protein